MSRIAIITINRNNAEGLKSTIASVLTQTCSEFEYIIVDGASTDSSISFIKDAAQKRTIKWISEPDSGIYNAMNKGVRMVDAQYILFLNSGDTFVDCNIVEHVMPLLDGIDILIGRVNITKNGMVTGTSKSLAEEDLNLFNLYLYGLPHQAAFIKKELLVVHPYDESLKINADWKSFLQEIILGNADVRLIPDIISNYDGDGYSSTHMPELLSERERIFKELVPNRIASDYLKVFPHYYEAKRVEWLLGHPAYYKLYRAISSFGMKLSKTK